MSKQRITLLATTATLGIALAGCGGGDAAETTAASATTSATEGAPVAPESTGEACFDQGKAFEGDTRLYIEHNATDKDTGVHGMFDQEGLAEACLQKPDGTQNHAGRSYEPAGWTRHQPVLLRVPRAS